MLYQSGITLRGQEQLLQVIGRQPSPRILVVGQPDEELTAAVERVAQTSRYLDEPSDLYDVRQRDWDAVVLVDCNSEIESDIFVLQFGVHGAGLKYRRGESDRQLTTYLFHSRAQEIHIPPAASDLVPSALLRDLAHVIRDVGTADVFGTQPVPGMTAEAKVNLDDAFHPLLQDPDGEILAAVVDRVDTPAQWWLLPRVTTQRGAWLEAAVAVWQRAKPESFPAPESGWQRSAAWSTREEVELREALEVARDTRQAVLEEQDALVGAREEALAAAGRRGDDGMRRLVSAQGGELVIAVIDALAALGFSTRDSDDFAKPGDHLEDLQVTHPDDSEWIALAEVRGYKRGAQLNDLLRIQRFATRYARDHGRIPTTCWYVVNHLLETPPSSRDAPLSSNPLELETFAEGGGLLLDTRVLFGLVREVELGRLKRDVVAAAIRGASGRMQLPLKESDEHS